MQTIGTFCKAGNHYTGSLQTLTVNVTLTIVPVERTSDQAPDFRIHNGSTEYGAAWKRTNDAGRDFLSIKLDDPALPAPIFASLFADDDADTYKLLWSRPKGR